MAVNDLLDLLDRRGWVRSEDLVEHHVSRDAMATLVRRRQIRRVRAGLWTRPDAPAATLHRAAVAVAGPDAALGRSAAAWWHGLIPGAVPLVLIGLGRDLTSNDAMRFVRTRHLCPRCVTSVRRLRVVTVERAALEHAMCLKRWTDVVAFLTGVVQRGRTSPARLIAMADHLHVRSTRLRGLLAEIAGGSRSAPEVEFIELVRRFGLPEPLRNVALTCADGITRYADLAYPAYGYYVEIDGRICHFGVVEWEADLARMNEISISCDLKPLRFTSRQIRERPEQVARQLARALGVRLLST